MTRISVREAAFAAAVGLAVYLVAQYCLNFPNDDGPIPGLWLANGVTLAALLRLPESRWPPVIIASLVASMVAGLSTDHLFVTAILAGSNVLQSWLCAFVVRRRFGSYFDITDLRPMVWLAVAGVATSVLKVAIALLLSLTVPAPVGLWDYVASWVLILFMGLIALALPILAITARTTPEQQPYDLTAAALTVLLAIVTAIVFGPFHAPGVFITIPALMLLAWRNGLFGAGVGALVLIIIGGALLPQGGSIVQQLRMAGFDAVERGFYLELFFTVAILMSLPLAIARSRQMTMEAALAGALSAAQRRAALLTDSEKAARTAEARAVQAQNRLRRIIETSTDIICTIDEEGRFVEISDNCEQIWGWPREALIGRPCIEFMHPDDRERSILDFRRRVDGQWHSSARNRYIRPDGTIVPMSWSANWIGTEGIGHCVGRDMSDHYALEAQVQLAQRMEAIGQLTGGVAHDFNNLLTVVIGCSETLTAELKDPDHGTLARLILYAAEQASELTQQLMAFARRQPLAPYLLDINELLDRNEGLIRRTIGGDILFSIEKAPDLSLAFADQSQTAAAILNLCINARDAMAGGGSLSITTANTTLSADYARLHPDARAGDYVMIRVADTGSGIPADVVGKIFEPFFTTKETGKGSGLGLSMVYGFVKQSDGYMEVDTELGRGTSFSIFLPVADESSAAAVAEIAPGDGIERGSENLLVVEDDDLVRAHVRTQLEGLGYQVVEAANAALAIGVLEQRDDIDMLFTDIVMPGGMNGRQLGEAVTARWPHIRILYTSGYSRDALSQDGRLLDGVILLPKPYSKRELSEKVRQVLDEIP